MSQPPPKWGVIDGVVYYATGLKPNDPRVVGAPVATSPTDPHAPDCTTGTYRSVKCSCGYDEAVERAIPAVYALLPDVAGRGGLASQIAHAALTATGARCWHSWERSPHLHESVEFCPKCKDVRPA
jgi:hypothetical protein